MDKNQEQPKRCFCARCFLPINSDDKVDIDNQNFHRMCSMCCICRTIPKSLKMFYGHVFCDQCFKTHVLTRFRGEPTPMHSNSWWMQWAPGVKQQETKTTDETKTSQESEHCQGCTCSRCLQPIVNADKVEIGGQCFHSQCAKCYFCHNAITSNIKIYRGQVFCESCFDRHILCQSKDNPAEFFKACFEQWQNNEQFAESMKGFMTGSPNNVPFVFMTQHGQESSFYRCGSKPPEWFQNNEPNKCA